MDFLAAFAPAAAAFLFASPVFTVEQAMVALEPDVKLAKALFPECTRRLSRVEIVPAITFADQSIQAGMASRAQVVIGHFDVRRQAVILTIAVAQLPAWWRRRVVLHEFAHCDYNQPNLGEFTSEDSKELQAEYRAIINEWKLPAWTAGSPPWFL